jgi:hypothetical protein
VHGNGSGSCQFSDFDISNVEPSRILPDSQPISHPVSQSVSQPKSAGEPVSPLAKAANQSVGKSAKVCLSVNGPTRPSFRQELK